MPYFLIGETRAAGGPLYVLWTRDESGVRITPWGSRDRRDIQAVGRSLAEMTPLCGNPGEQADVILAGALRHATGRRVRLVDLSVAEQATIARTISDGLGEPHGRVSRTDVQNSIDPEVLALVGQRLAGAS